MAHPLSEEKRQVILQATIQLFSSEEINASTSKIAKLAKISEGSIFTYFSNKDELVNQLYLELKGDLQATLATIPETASLKGRIWFAWKSFFLKCGKPRKTSGSCKIGYVSQRAGQ